MDIRQSNRQAYPNDNDNGMTLLQYYVGKALPSMILKLDINEDPSLIACKTINIAKEIIKNL